MIILREKTYATLVDGSGKSIMDFKKEWEASGSKGTFKEWYTGKNTGLAATNNKITQDAAARASQRAANIANPGAAAAKAGFQRGVKSVGVMEGLENTWASAGKMGKAGMVAGGVASAALLAKGAGSILSKKKDQ